MHSKEGHGAPNWLPFPKQVLLSFSLLFLNKKGKRTMSFPSLPPQEPLSLGPGTLCSRPTGCVRWRGS